MPEEDREDQLRAHQDGRVYPLGRALRTTYDAENHDSLGSDVTGLMIDLAKVPYEPMAMSVHALAPAPASFPVAIAPSPRSLRDRLGLLWRGGRQPA